LAECAYRLFTVHYIKLTKAWNSWNCTNLCICHYNKWRHFWYRYWYWVLVSLDTKVLGIWYE